MKYTSILFLGTPGAGKGTQGKMFGALPGFCHCSSGDIFRQLDQYSEAGRIFLQYATRGELVPDEFTIDLLKNYVRGLELTFRFRPQADILILDGIPRNLRQADLLEDMIDVGKVIHLETNDMNKMIERLKGRALKERRHDDADEAVIRNRLDVYAKNTEPLLRHYPPDKIARVEATLTPIEVFLEILKILTPIKVQFDQVRCST